MQAEGWYVDPFAAHAARWFSGGRPTALVRDGGTVFQDEPPSRMFRGRLQAVESPAVGGVEDLLRVDSDTWPIGAT